MNTGSKLFLAIILSLISGFAGGYYLSSGQKVVPSPAISEPPIEEYSQNLLSDIGAEDCSELPLSSQLPCVEGLLVQKAIEARDTSYCDELSTELSQSGCETRVNRLLSLASFDAGSLCDEVESELCPDSVLLLTAEDTGDAEQCLKMSNEEYKQFCLRLVATPEAQANLIASGNVCQLGDTVCEKNNQILAQALSSNNASLCSGATNEAFTNFCQKETLIYQAYTSQNEAVCVSLTDPNENMDCVNTVRISSILSSQSQDCSVVDPGFTQVCQRAISLGFHPRFSLVESQ